MSSSLSEVLRYGSFLVGVGSGTLYGEEIRKCNMIRVGDRAVTLDLACPKC